MEQDLVYQTKWESITYDFIERRRTWLGKFLASFLIIWFCGLMVVVGTIIDLPRNFAQYHSEILPHFMKFCHIIYCLLSIILSVTIIFTVWIFLSLILALCSLPF